MNDNLKRLNEYDRHIKQDIDEPNQQYNNEDWQGQPIIPGTHYDYALTESGWVHRDEVEDFFVERYGGFVSGDEILGGLV